MQLEKFAEKMNLMNTSGITAFELVFKSGNKLADIKPNSVIYDVDKDSITITITANTASKRKSIFHSEISSIEALSYSSE